MDFKLPELGEGVYEAEFIRWLVKVGDAVESGQNLLEVLTDKARMEVPSPFAGTIMSLHAEKGQTLKIGDVVLSYTPLGETSEAPVPASRSRTPAALQEVSRSVAVAHPNGGALPVKAAPSVRLLARKMGVDLAHITGTGPGGRILVEDLTRSFRPSAGEPPVRAEARPDYGMPGTRVKLRGLRRRIAEHMVRATHTIPHYSCVVECDVTELVQIRDSLREPFARAGLKLTYLPFIVKAVVKALKDIPIVNASLDDETEEIVFHDRYNLGIAVATNDGLIVPVIKNADQRDLASITREIDRLSHAARSGKATRDDLTGGTFTITSVGNLGGIISTPVINHPEVGILGIGKVVRRPVYDDNGEIRPADQVYLSFSFDHRVVDGAVGLTFANVLVQELQNPARLLLPEKLG
jgi:pyruvate dehydrogenase E2 component (dihydrolipoamide acetyltransferase)/2-oxoisovalerate dehydrogenase E2 component (dihydrolipoyl transacylase)